MNPVWAYIAGIIDGEGHIDKRNCRIDISNNSSAVLDTVQTYCSSLGIDTIRYDSLVVPRVIISRRTNLNIFGTYVALQSIKQHDLCQILENPGTKKLLTVDEARYYLGAVIDGEGYISTQYTNRCVFIGNTDLVLLRAAAGALDILDITYTLCLSNRAKDGKPPYYVLIVRSKDNHKRMIEHNLPIFIQYKQDALFENACVMRPRKRQPSRDLIKEVMPV